MHFSIQATFLSALIVLAVTNVSLAELSRSESQNNFPFLLQKYLAEQKLKNSKNVNKNFGSKLATSKKDDFGAAVVLPDGLPPKLAVEPGNRPRKLPNSPGKRSDFKQSEMDMTCKEHEWFVFIDEMPACVNPVWDGGYDPTYCAKMKSGWVYCGCMADQVPGMIEGLDTCINRDKLRNGRCKIKPCPFSFRCEEDLKNKRYDCIKENMKVPTWY